MAGQIRGPDPVTSIIRRQSLQYLTVVSKAMTEMHAYYVSILMLSMDTLYPLAPQGIFDLNCDYYQQVELFRTIISIWHCLCVVDVVSTSWEIILDNSFGLPLYERQFIF